LSFVSKLNSGEQLMADDPRNNSASETQGIAEAATTRPRVKKASDGGRSGSRRSLSLDERKEFAALIWGRKRAR
jgi:hypothetical protein